MRGRHRLRRRSLNRLRQYGKPGDPALRAFQVSNHRSKPRSKAPLPANACASDASFRQSVGSEPDGLAQFWESRRRTLPWWRARCTSERRDREMSGYIETTSRIGRFCLRPGVDIPDRRYRAPRTLTIGASGSDPYARPAPARAPRHSGRFACRSVPKPLMRCSIVWAGSRGRASPRARPRSSATAGREAYPGPCAPLPKVGLSRNASCAARSPDSISAADRDPGSPVAKQHGEPGRCRGIVRFDANGGPEVAFRVMEVALVTEKTGREDTRCEPRGRGLAFFSRSRAEVSGAMGRPMARASARAMSSDAPSAASTFGPVESACPDCATNCFAPPQVEHSPHSRLHGGRRFPRPHRTHPARGLRREYLAVGLCIA